MFCSHSQLETSIFVQTRELENKYEYLLHEYLFLYIAYTQRIYYQSSKYFL